MTNRTEAAETQPHRRGADLGRAIQCASLLVLAGGFVAEQAGWLRFESSRTHGALLALMGAGWLLEDMMNRRLSRVNGENAPPNGGPAAQLENSGGAERLARVSGGARLPEQKP